MDIKKLIYKIKTLKSILIFKRFLVCIVINPFVGRIIRIIMKREIKFHDTRIDISTKSISNLQVAALFFSHYESKEVYFLNKYLNIKIPCIELGSSLGIVSCQIGKKNSNKKIFVEANNHLIAAIDNNLKLNNFNNYAIINAAISYEKSDFLEFEIAKNNLVGKIKNNPTKSEIVKVKCIKLIDIIEENKIIDYSLVMDVEGAEYELILNEKTAFKNCKQIIAEFHDFEYHGKKITFRDIKNLYIKSGFKLIDSYYNRYVFEK